MRLKPWKFIVCSLFIAVGIAIAIFGSILNRAYRDRPQDIVYPSGKTESDIFTQQNYEFYRDSDFPENYIFDKCLYKIGSPKWRSASLGNGIIYKDGAYSVYITEYDGDNLYNALNSEFIYSESSTANPELTDGEILYRESGYINSFKVVFQIIHFKITDDNQKTYDRYIAGYQIEVPKELILREEDTTQSEQDEEDSVKPEDEETQNDNHYIWTCASSPKLSNDELIALRDYIYPQLFSIQTSH